jgi:hypothetical protein
MLPLSHDDSSGRNQLPGRMLAMNGNKLRCFMAICLRIQEQNYCLWDVNLVKVLNGTLREV